MCSASSEHETGLLIAFTVQVIPNEWCAIWLGTYGWNVVWVLLSRAAIMLQWLLFDNARSQIPQGLSWRNLGAQLLGLQFWHMSSFSFTASYDRPVYECLFYWQGQVNLSSSAVSDFAWDPQTKANQTKPILHPDTTENKQQPINPQWKRQITPTTSFL